MKDLQHLQLSIDDLVTLELASRYLHDAVFAPASLNFDADAGEFSIHLWREETSAVREEKLLWFVTRLRFRRAECRLVFRDVEHVDISTHSRLTYHSLFRIRYWERTGRLQFETEGAMKMEASLRSLKGELCDTGITTWDQFGYSTLHLTDCCRRRVSGRRNGTDN